MLIRSKALDLEEEKCKRRENRKADERLTYPEAFSAQRENREKKVKERRKGKKKKREKKEK